MIGAALIFIAALLYSAVGHAGASGYLAVMAFLGTPPAAMRPTALLLNLLVAAIGTVQFARAGYFRWSLFWPFALGSIPAAYLGGHLSLPGTTYRLVVGVVLVLSAARFVITLRAPDGVKRHVPVPAALVIGAVLGLLAGLTGVGGGIFLSPLLLIAGWAGTKQTSAVAAPFILVNSIAGLAGAFMVKSTALPWHTWILVCAVLVGGWFGAEYGSRRFANPLIRRVLAIVLAVAGAKMIAV